jgi:hypothetical protein
MESEQHTRTSELRHSNPFSSMLRLSADAMAMVYQEELCKDAPESRKDRAVVICQGSKVEGQGYTPPAAPFLKKLDWDLDGAVSPKPGVPSLQGISGTVMTKELVGAGGALAGLTLGFVSGKRCACSFSAQSAIPKTHHPPTKDNLTKGLIPSMTRSLQLLTRKGKEEEEER